MTTKSRSGRKDKPSLLRRLRSVALFEQLGPGLITGAADDDPSGIATYSQAGAQFGYAMCWTMLLTYPLMAAIQEISGRIGRVTGQGIAGNIRIHYPKSLLRVIVALLLIANIINQLGSRISLNSNYQAVVNGGFLVLVVLAQTFLARRQRL